MLDKLKVFDDPKFKFDATNHSYFYMNLETGKPVQFFESVSSFISQFSIPFDAKTISKFVARKQKITQQEVLDKWEQTRKEGTDLGSKVHLWIEEFYNNNNPKMPLLPDSCKVHEDVNPMGTMEERFYDRIYKFKQIHEEKLHKMNPIRQEVKIFSRKWGIAGTLDSLLFLNPFYYVGDWKTNKKFTTDDLIDGRRQKLLPPFDDLWDNNLNKYSLQLSTYRLILKEEAGFETNGGFLVWLGPNKSKMYKTIDLIERIRDFLEENNFNL